MNISRFLHKPEYFFRPHQALRRVYSAFAGPKAAMRVQLPWKQLLLVNPTETIGRSLCHMGVYDLVLTECLWRFATPGTKAADIGANIGYFSLLLSHRVGVTGKVWCFEPHPKIFQRLKGNLKPQSVCQLHNLALSAKKGTMTLHVPQDFDGNEGTASLEPSVDKEGAGQSLSVAVETLDSILFNQKVDLIKIDVEGHELDVFTGGSETLKTVQNIFFEDFQGSRSSAIAFLKNQGFEVFRIQKKFWGPALISVEDGERLPLWEPPNYLATRDSKKAFKTLQPRGWFSLKEN